MKHYLIRMKSFSLDMRVKFGQNRMVILMGKCRCMFSSKVTFSLVMNARKLALLLLKSKLELMESLPEDAG